MFGAGSEVIENIKTTASTFFTDIAAAFAKDADGKVQLDAALSGLFNAGADAMAGLVTSAGTLVADIVGKITGKEEDAKKIGEVFSDLFGVASEVTLSIKDDTIAFFGWFKDHGDVVANAISGIGLALAGLTISNPTFLAIAGIIGLIAAMNVDWKNFEQNYPQLAQMFTDFTGMDFSDAADSLANLQEGLNGIVTWFAENEAALSALLILLGGLAMYTGHYVAGTALIAAGGGIVESSIAQAWKEAAGNAQDGATPSVFGEKGEYTEDPLAGMTWEELQALGGALPVNASPELQRKPSIWQRFLETANEFFGMGGEDDGNGLHWNTNDNGVIYDHGGGFRRWEEGTDGTGGSTGIAGLIGALQALPAQIEAAVKAGASSGASEGVGNITVTGSITTGNITLDTGVVAGAVAPKVDWKLGSKFGRASG